MLVILCSCRKGIEINTPVKIEGVFIYMIADNNLSFFATKDINEMEASLKPEDSHRVYVYADKGRNSTPSHPYILEITPDTTQKIVSKIIYSYPESNSSSQEILTKSLNHASSHAKKYNVEIEHIVLWSHGNAWLPKRYKIYSDSLVKNSNLRLNLTKSFGLDEYITHNKKEEGEEMDIKDIVSALSGKKYKTLAFDACFMGAIEVAYQLRNTCEKLIVSPAEVLSFGYPYKEVIYQYLHSENNAIDVAKSYSEYYSSLQGQNNSYTISVINLSYMTDLTSFIAKEFGDIQYTLTEKQIDSFQQYERLKLGYFFDLKQIMDTFLTLNNEKLQRLNSLWSKVVEYESHSHYMLGSLKLENVNGLSIYVPHQRTYNDELITYYKNLLWYEYAQNFSFWHNY